MAAQDVMNRERNRTHFRAATPPLGDRPILQRSPSTRPSAARRSCAAGVDSSCTKSEPSPVVRNAEPNAMRTLRRCIASLAMTAAALVATGCLRPPSPADHSRVGKRSHLTQSPIPEGTFGYSSVIAPNNQHPIGDATRPFVTYLNQIQAEGARIGRRRRRMATLLASKEIVLVLVLQKQNCALLSFCPSCENSRAVRCGHRDVTQASAIRAAAWQH